MEVGLAVLSFEVGLAVLSFDWPGEVQLAANGRSGISLAAQKSGSGAS